MKRRFVVLAIVLSSPIAVRADEAVQREMGHDVVLRALVDELERGKLGLQLEDLERPYFIEYGLDDGASAYATAALGAVTDRNSSRSRRLQSEVRVGSYELDNTNFSGGYGGFDFGDMFGPFGFGAPIPLEDDYDAIRQGIWWATDRQYKSVVETFVKKKALMESKVIEDRPADFSREAPVVHFEDRAEVSLDADRLEQIAVSLSKIFREYPDVKKSSASVLSTVGNKYLVNTEGTRLRTVESRCSVSVNATVQADDGMELSDSISLHCRRVEDLPSLEELSGQCRDMAKRLIEVKNAPLLENYTGPVLFDAEAAAAIFSQRFARHFGGGQRQIGSRRSAEDFANKLNRRILPRFMRVVDDPTKSEIAGVPVMGRYDYDDQGVPARAVTLVENGRLKAQLMGRNPSKEFDKSNGHGRGSRGSRGQIGCLVVTADPAEDAATLKQDLIEACEDEGLEYGLRIAALGGGGGGSRYAGYFRGFDLGDFDYGGYGRGGSTNPLVIYKVYKDGREELVRGAEAAQIDLKAFKRMLAAGDEPYVLNTGGSTPQTVVAPAMLFEELDLAKVDRDFDKPPILPSPLARGKDQGD